MSSGVTVADECLTAFQGLKLKKEFKFIIYRLSDDATKIVVAKTSKSPSYDDFLEELPPSSCCYAVLDLEFEKGSDGKRSKICFFQWSPDEARIKEKMMYASGKSALRQALVGVSAEIQATDASEAAFDHVLEKVGRNTF